MNAEKIIPLPERIGPYTLIERLGSGGMGEVWLARRSTRIGGANKIVAVKLVPTTVTDGTDAWRLFEAEARLSMMMSHSNIVQVFDVGEYDSRGYLAMEWVDGVNLATILNQARAVEGEFGFDLAAYVIGEMLNGLSYAHGLVDAGQVVTIIHRDISPHNVLTSVSGEVKITDFGIARLHSEETSGMHVRGKLCYMPPEQIAGHARSPCSDLFAVGAILHEMLSGKGFRRDVPPEGLFAVVAAGLVPPLQRPNVPQPLRDLLRGLLAPRCCDRIQSASEALVLLRGWSGYHDMRTELGELVRAVTGIDAPRSGQSMSARTAGWEASDVMTAKRSLARHPEILTSVEPASMSVNHDAVTRREQIVTDVELVPNVPPAPAVPNPTDATRSRSHARSLPAIAVCLVGGLWLALLEIWRPWEQELELVATQTSDPIHQELVFVPTPESSAPASRLDEVEPRVEPKPEPAPAPISAPPVRQPRRVHDAPVSPAPLPRSTVTFTSGEFHWLEIMVGKRKLSVDPRESISLAPGSYPVQLRAADGNWRAVGQLEIDVGHDYRVDFTLPASFRRTEIPGAE